MKKRVLSMLLVLVMMGGLFPTTALAEETQPCSTMFCILEKGHTGDCEISVSGGDEEKEDDPQPTDDPGQTDDTAVADQTAAQAIIDLIAVIGTVTLESESAISAADMAYNALTDAQKALVTNLDVLDAAKAAFSALSVPAPVSDPAADAVVYVSGASGGTLFLVNAPVTVTDINSDGLLSYDEAMVAAHNAYCPGGYSSNMGDLGVQVGMLWGQGNGVFVDALFYNNDKELDWNVGESYVNAGDLLFAGLLTDPMNWDIYTHFDNKALVVNAGEEFKLTLTGSAYMSDPFPIPYVEIGTWNSDDKSFSAISGACTDESGNITLSFDSAGTYVVSASGYATNAWGSYCPIAPPFCVVTVTAAEVAVDSISLDNTSVSLTAGETTTLTATVGPEEATDKTVTWTSSDDSIATVADGVVTAVAAGTATITAKAGDKTATCEVTVNLPESDGGINLTLTVSNLGTLALVRGSFTVSDRDGDNIITYDEALYAAHDVYCPGGYEVEYGGEYNATVVKVWGAGSGSNANALFIRNGIPLTMNVADTEASAVSDGDDLYVSINASDMGTDWYTYFDNEYLTVEAGQSFTLSLSGFLGMTWGEPIPAAVPNATVGLWEDGSFTAIDGKTTDENGQVTLSFDTAGTYVVSASGSIYDEMWYADCPLMAPFCVVTVNGSETPPVDPVVPVSSVSLNETSLELEVGASETLTAEVLPENAADKTVTWSSSDDTVATVADGVVTAVAAGEATITAKAGEKTATCVVTVVAAAEPVAAYLQDLKFTEKTAENSTEYELKPAFDPAVKEYELIVPDEKTAIAVRATLADGQSEEVNAIYKSTAKNNPETTIAIPTISAENTKGKTLGSCLANDLATKTITIKVGEEEAYTITVVRKASIKNLTLTYGDDDAKITLTPAKFSRDVTEYSAVIPAAADVIKVKAQGTRSAKFGASVRINDIESNEASPYTVEITPEWSGLNAVIEIVASSTVDYPHAIPTTYTINLTRELTYEPSLEILTPPTKTEYVEGEKFDPTGMTLKMTHEDGSTEEIGPDKFTYPTDPLTSSMTEIELGYSDLTVKQPITVQPVYGFKGEGTADDPHLIETADDLVKLSEYVKNGDGFKGKCFKMVNDIALPAGWSPIGSSTETRFRGSFDGGGKLLTVPAGGLPLFGYVGGATIKNLSIYGTQIAGYGLINNFVELDENIPDKGVTISGITLKSGTSTLKSGLLGGYQTTNPYGGSTRFSEAHISNCTIESGVVIGYNRDQSYIGSIAGRMQGSITNCTSSATVYGADYVGGILGCRDNSLGSCSISGSSFGGSVSASGSHAGGIVGGGYVGFTAAVEASAPNGNRTNITGCTVTGSISGAEKVGGIIGGDSFVAQTWAANSIKNNSFTGSVSGSSYVGGIIGYYLSLNKFDDIANNYYSGASTGIGFVKYVDTSCTTHETASGAEYFSTESGTSGCPSVTGSHWKTGLNRTDDPLGADKAKLCYTDADTEPVATELVVSGTYKTEYIKGEELDLTGIVLTVNYNKGDPKIIELKDVTVDGYDKDKLGDQQLTISYKGLTAFITVNVKSDKEEITVTVSILGDSIHGDSGAVHTLAGGNLSTWVSAAKYTVDSNSTAWDVIKQCLDENGYSCSNPTGNYIKAINGLAEFSNGTLSGWMYTLNGGHSSLGVSEQHLDDGDVIVVHYSDDYTIDDPMGRPNNTNNAAAVEKLIKEIGTVSLDSKSKIEAARKAYDALSYAEKQKVTNYSTLTAAEAEFAKLKEDDDKKAAAEVVELINKIGKYSDEFKDKVKAARKAYDALTEDQKELVNNYDILVQAEKLLATEEDKKAAEEVEKLIKLIGKKVSLDSKKKIELARKAYDMLTATQKNLVDNYKDLVAAEEILAKLEELEETLDIYKITGDYLEKLGTPVSGDIGGEWMALGLVRSDRKVDAAYYDSVVKFVQENIDENERLHSAKSSENSRVILALTAMGKDVTNVDGHNLLEGLTDMDYLHKQGINGPIWALIAFDSGNYPIPEGNVSRAGLIDTILDAQLADGGWALGGTVSDPDMTGMALTALAPYYASNDKDAKPIVEKFGKERSAEIRKAVEEALKTLSEMQNADGGYSSIDGPNSESISQVLVALSALGIDADTDRRFIKNDVSMLDALCSFYVEGGGFRHIPDGKLNGMATEQAYYALTAYFRMLDSKTALYDMTDVIDKGGDKEPVKAEEAKTEKVEKESKPAPTEAPKVSESKRPSFWSWLKNIFS